MHYLERDERHLIAGVDLLAPYKDEGLEPIFARQEGDEQITWEGDIPSQKTAWRNIDGVRTPCDYYAWFGFLTQSELWEHRKKYPRDGL